MDFWTIGINLMIINYKSSPKVNFSVLDWAGKSGLKLWINFCETILNLKHKNNMLHNFFSINLPYGILKNANNEWVAFNREYLPLGFNSRKHRVDLRDSGLPIHTKYRRIREDTLLKLALDSSYTLGEDGKISQIWFYNDGTNPMHEAKNWKPYIEKLKILSKFTVEGI